MTQIQISQEDTPRQENELDEDFDLIYSKAMLDCYEIEKAKLAYTMEPQLQTFEGFKKTHWTEFSKTSVFKGDFKGEDAIEREWLSLSFMKMMHHPERYRTELNELKKITGTITRGETGNPESI